MRSRALAERLIAARREAVRSVILREAPEHDQRNVAIGGILEPDEEERIRAVIRARRADFQAYRAEILAISEDPDRSEVRKIVELRRMSRKRPTQ